MRILISETFNTIPVILLQERQKYLLYYKVSSLLSAPRPLLYPSVITCPQERSEVMAIIQLPAPLTLELWL